MSDVPLPVARSVLVTGASGLIGSQVVALLAADRARSRRSWPSTCARCPPDGVEPASTTPWATSATPASPTCSPAHDVDTVVHLAAIVTAGTDSTRELEYSIDVLGTGNVVDAAWRTG